MVKPLTAGLIGLTSGLGFGYLFGNFFPAIKPAVAVQPTAPEVITRLAERKFSITINLRNLSIDFLDKNFNILWKDKVTIIEFKRNGTIINEGTGGMGVYIWDSNVGSLVYVDTISATETVTIKFSVNGKTYSITTVLNFNQSNRLIFQTLEV